MLRKMLERSERGQAIVLIAVGLVALIVMIGLMADGGMLFIEYGRLKRGIDAAALSAALQYREGYTDEQLNYAAREFLVLNQIDVFDIQVDTCNTLPGDAELCTSPQRKLVRVTASRDVDFNFLTIVGWDRTTLTASSVGEAASVDIVLIIDASASMAFEGDGGNPNYADVPEDDPSFCNPIHSCQPLEQIKTVAKDFIDEALWFPYDRVAIVTFDRDPHLILALTDDGNAVTTAINSLTVFQPDKCVWGPPFPANPSFGPCLNYPPPDLTYKGLDCPLYRYGPDLTLGTADDTTLNPSSCTSSNIGGALIVAGAEFAQPPVREDSLWVVILLAGGPANTGLVDHPQFGGQEFPDRICPPSTWGPPTGNLPWCRDASASSRHLSGSENYDADDYARDKADFVADPVNGQGAVIFSIGLGNMVQNAPPPSDPDAGEKLLDYAARCAGEGLWDCPKPCPDCTKANHGQYFHAPTAADLREIFRAIADNIATILRR
jgi:Flp pilus assembly protein TadG